MAWVGVKVAPILLLVWHRLFKKKKKCQKILKKSRCHTKRMMGVHVTRPPRPWTPTQDIRDLFSIDIEGEASSLFWSSFAVFVTYTLDPYRQIALPHWMHTGYSHVEVSRGRKTNYTLPKVQSSQHRFICLIGCLKIIVWFNILGSDIKSMLVTELICSGWPNLNNEKMSLNIVF